jgi:hypothetical protein
VCRIACSSPALSKARWIGAAFMKLGRAPTTVTINDLGLLSEPDASSTPDRAAGAGARVL